MPYDPAKIHHKASGVLFYGAKLRLQKYSFEYLFSLFGPPNGTARPFPPSTHRQKSLKILSQQTDVSWWVEIFRLRCFQVEIWSENADFYPDLFQLKQKTFFHCVWYSPHLSLWFQLQKLTKVPTFLKDETTISNAFIPLLYLTNRSKMLLANGLKAMKKKNTCTLSWKVSEEAAIMQMESTTNHCPFDVFCWSLTCLWICAHNPDKSVEALFLPHSSQVVSVTVGVMFLLCLFTFCSETRWVSNLGGSCKDLAPGAQVKPHQG